MKGKPNKTEKTIYTVSTLAIFILGVVTASSFSIGTLTSYLAMVGAIFVALTISYIILKTLFASSLNKEGENLKFDEMAVDKKEINKKY